MKYYAFLRAINVSGHTVKMAALKQIFESLGLVQVETFIASGNVGFETTISDMRELGKSIEDKLQASLGFEVATFLRTEAELNEIVRFQPFSESAMKTAISINVIFLKEQLDASDSKKVLFLETPTDDFHLHGREIYWLVRTRQSESSFSNAVLEKTIKASSTIRGIETVRKMISLDNG